MLAALVRHKVATLYLSNAIYIRKLKSELCSAPLFTLEGFSYVLSSFVAEEAISNRPFNSWQSK